jgi:hypothetical protein
MRSELTGAAVRWLRFGRAAFAAMAFWSLQAAAVEYVTPVCPRDPSCVVVFPEQPVTTTPTDIYFAVYSGLPYVARTPNLTTQISGNVITVSGTYVMCDDGCFDIGHPPPVPVHVLVGPLPAGHYVATLFLSADPSYQDPPPVMTTSGSVYAGITITGEFDVVQGQSNRAVVVEYYDSEMDHYFMTSNVDEIALLDAAQPPFEHWARTGLGFAAYIPQSGVPNAVPICRFFNDSFAPKSSHFYAAHGEGCETTLLYFPDWKLESSDAFEIGLPASDGTCPASTMPVYRMYNSGMGGAPNHRFTTSQDVRNSMLAQGWVAEGYGVGVIMCAPGE